MSFIPVYLHDFFSDQLLILTVLQYIHFILFFKSSRNDILKLARYIHNDFQVREEKLKQLME